MSSLLGSNLGFRQCYRRSVHHHPDNLRCDCLRTEIPVEAQAKSSGRLGTPDRNHDCPRCGGTGRVNSVAHGFIACGRCWGIGELTARGRALRAPPDRDLRQAVTFARKAGNLGRRS